MVHISEAAQDSEMKRTLSPTDEETCKVAHNPRKVRQIKARERFLRVRPDGIAHLSCIFFGELKDKDGHQNN